MASDQAKRKSCTAYSLVILPWMSNIGAVCFFSKPVVVAVLVVVLVVVTIVVVIVVAVMVVAATMSCGNAIQQPVTG